jgi:MFS transporter, FHS family, L-fucose permease
MPLQTQGRNRFIVGLVFLIFFVISFLTNIIGPLIPDIIRSFGLSLGLAGFLPFSFFVAYGVMSIPAGVLVERFGEKKVLLISFLVAALGSWSFALRPTFGIALVSLFLIGIGMAMLQVALNPLLRVTGGEEHFAFNAVFSQLVFGSASYLSPLVYSSLVSGLSGRSGGLTWYESILSGITEPALPWTSLYWIFGLVSVTMLAVIGAVRLPTVVLAENERIGALATHRELLANAHVRLYFLGIFCYVGTEQGLANWMSKFLSDYHGFDAQTVGASAVSWFWGMLTAGCVLGMLLLKLFDSRKILIAFVLAALACLGLGLFAPAQISLWAFPAAGFCLSVMWSIVFSLALNSAERHHGTLSGILCTGIVGGAIVPLAIGYLGDLVGLRYSMMVIFLTLGYLLSIGFWARPIIANATVSLPRKEQEA